MLTDFGLPLFPPASIMSSGMKITSLLALTFTLATPFLPGADPELPKVGQVFSDLGRVKPAPIRQSCRRDHSDPLLIQLLKDPAVDRKTINSGLRNPLARNVNLERDRTPSSRRWPPGQNKRRMRQAHPFLVHVPGMPGPATSLPGRPHFLSLPRGRRGPRREGPGLPEECR